jgi:hypothetical protein
MRCGKLLLFEIVLVADSLQNEIDSMRFLFMRDQGRRFKPCLSDHFVRATTLSCNCALESQGVGPVGHSSYVRYFDSFPM